MLDKDLVWIGGNDEGEKAVHAGHWCSYIVYYIKCPGY
jgi:hypothetical protein